jgi:hypothetical protein
MKRDPLLVNMGLTISLVILHHIFRSEPKQILLFPSYSQGNIGTDPVVADTQDGNFLHTQLLVSEALNCLIVNTNCCCAYGLVCCLPYA